MAGHGVSITTICASWRLFWATCLALCIVATSAAQPQKVYDLDLTVGSVADALNSLSEQTGVPVVFPYDLVKDRTANPVIGRYTLLGALDELLKGTGLSGGVSDRGVLTISPPKSGAPNPGEPIVMSQNKQQQTTPTKPGKSAGIAALLASIAAAFSASAEEASAGPDGLESVVVTAQKRSEKLEDVPVPVSVINAGTLTDTAQVLLRDYYSSVPGLSVSPDINSAEHIAIRGITTSDFGAPTVGIVVDDVPYGASGGRADGLFAPDFDPADLAHIEVLRGPQGTLYGANSMGGLIKYVTVDPSTSGYSASVSAGSNSVFNGAAPGFSVRGSVNMPISDTLAIRISAYRRQDPGYIDNVLTGQKGVNEAQADGARFSALWKPSDLYSLKLSAMYQQILTNGLPEEVQQAGLGALQQNFVAGMGTDHQVQAYSAIFNAKLGPVELTSLTGYNINRSLSSFDFTPFFADQTQNGIPGSGFTGYGVTGTPMHPRIDFSKITQEFRLAGSLRSTVDWVAGVFYTHESDVNRENVYAAVPTTGEVLGETWDSYYPDYIQEYAGFLNLTFHITDRLDVQVGGRESQTKVTEKSYSTGPFDLIIDGAPSPFHPPDQSEKENAFTYLLTPSFKVTSDLMAYARLASGYRPGAPNANLPGIPPQKPDKTENYELGLKGEFLNGALTVDGSLYYIHWKDIQLSLIDAQKTSYGFNGSAAKSEGVELSVTARPVRGFTITTWGTYDDAVLTQSFPFNSTAHGVPGDRLPNTPRFSANVSLEQTFPVGKDSTAFLGATAGYIGDRTGTFTATAQRQDLPAYTKTDLRAGVESSGWTTTLYANNVANTRGLLNGGVGYVQPNAFVYITPRTIGITVSHRF